MLERKIDSLGIAERPNDGVITAELLKNLEEDLSDERRYGVSQTQENNPQLHCLVNGKDVYIPISQPEALSYQNMDDNQRRKFVEAKYHEMVSKNAVPSQPVAQKEAPLDKVKMQINVGENTVSKFVSTPAMEKEASKAQLPQKIDAQALVASAYDDLNKSLSAPSRGLSR